MKPKLIKILLFIVAPILLVGSVALTLCLVLIKPNIKIEKPKADDTIYTYTGEEITYKIDYNDAYTVSNDKNTNAGEYVVLVSLVDKNKYVWADGSKDDLEYSFIINKDKIDKPVGKDLFYNGESQKLAKESTKYDLEGNNKTDVGEYSVIARIKDKVNYIWSDNTNLDYEFKSRILPLDSENLSINLDVAAYEYTGEEIKPEPVIKYNDITLTNTSDYDLTYSDNINIGKGKINVTLKNNYSGNLNIDFTITKKVLAKPEEDKDTHTFTGEFLEYKLEKSDYYTIKNNKQDQAGTYTVYVELKDKDNSCWEDGTTTDLEYEFVIEPKEVKDFIYEYQLSYTYNGNSIEPEIKVKDGDIDLILDNDYRLEYLDNINAGTAKIKITGINNYTGFEEKKFTINKCKVNKPEADTNQYIYNYNNQEYIIENSTLYSVEGNVKADAGTTKVIISLNDTANYSWDDETITNLEYDFLISPKDISGFVIKDIEEQTFTMFEIKPNLVINDGELVTNNDWYEFTYEDNIYVGKGKVTVSGTKNYTGTLEKEFTIVKALVEKPAKDNTVYKYNGDEQIYNILTGETVFYDVTGDYKKKSAGNYNFTVSLKYPLDSEWADHTTSNLSYDFEILKRDFSDSDVHIEAVSDQEYTGNDIRPNVIITVGNSKYPLVKDTDYTLSYDNNIQIGIATIYINHTGDNMTGSTSVTFNIVKAKISVLNALDKTFTYNGLEQTYNLTENALYTITNNKKTNAGEYTVTVSLDDPTHYEWSDGTSADKTYEFVINKRRLDDGVTLNIRDDLTYTGSVIEPNDFDLKINNYVIPTTSYDVVSYSNNINVGNGKIKITPTDSTNFVVLEYELEFVIKARNINDCTILDVADQTYTSYEIKPELSISYNLNDLSVDTDYLLTYSNNINSGTATIKVEGTGNYKGSKNVNFTINKKSVEGSLIKLVKESKQFSYLNGNSVEPEIKSVTLDDLSLVLNNDYTVSYSNNKHIGVATLTITGINNFTGTESTTFTILNENYDIAKAIISQEIKTHVYNGAEIKPSVTVSIENTVLVLDTDYELTYSNNVNAGEASIKVKGINDYGNEKTVTFTIEPKEITATDVIISDIASKVYDGNEYEPLVIITDSIGVIDSSNYTLSYNDNINCGTGTVEITFKNNYKSNQKLTKTFEITQKSISTATNSDLGFITETGYEIKPTPTIKVDGITLVLNTDYTLSYVNNIHTNNNAKIYVEGIGNYKDTYEITFEIKPEVIDYDITYDLNEQGRGVATNNENNPTTYNWLSGTIELKPASMPGYTFVNWKLNGNIITSIISYDEDNPDLINVGNLELVAEWKETSYNINYNMNDSEASRAVNKNTRIYHIGESYELIAPTRTGYVFIGWTCQELEILTPTKDVTLPMKVNGEYYYGDVTLTANWEAA